jgi:hypothetical protein
MRYRISDDEFREMVRALWLCMTPEEREEVWPARERVKGLSPEDLLRALAPEERERLRQLLQSQMKADDPTHTQQIHQFRQQAKEFAMQRFDADLVKAMRDLCEGMHPQEREDVWPAEVRLKDLSPEDLLRALSPDELERLRQLLQSQTKADDPTRPQ